MNRKIENIIAASYLSGAAEALKKSTELTPEGISENLEDLKVLRRKFLAKSESDGFTQPSQHIEEAKKYAFEALKEHKPGMNTSTSTTTSTTSTGAPASGIFSAISGITDSIKSFTMGSSQVPAPAPVPSSSSNEHTHLNNPVIINSHLTTEHTPLINSHLTTEHTPLINSHINSHIIDTHNSAPILNEKKSNISLPPVVHLGGKKKTHRKKKLHRKKKTQHKRR